ncbi:MAG TPA: DUF4252 domain-containing protein [Gammaproteobacteria bacterium]|nr:DUF4252 domain-containing protein [Gammaproteobacteria bacterium]
MRLRTLALTGLIPLLTACGITGNFRNDAGYADFGPLQRLDAESDFGLSLGPLPLQIAKWATHDDEDLGPLLRELRAVRVYTIEGIADAEEAAARARKVTADLTGDGWLTVAAVRDGEELTSVLLRPDKNFTHRGLAVIVQEPGELVLVNLIGEIHLDFINGYLADLDVDVPPIEIDPKALQAALTHPASPAAGTGP